MYNVVSVLLVSLFLFIGCASSPSPTITETKNTEPKVTITADNYPAVFDNYFRGFISTHYELERRVKRDIENGNISPEDGTWINYEFFLENVAKKPGYVNVARFRDPINKISVTETCYLEYYSSINYSLRITKNIYTNGSRSFFIVFMTGASSWHPLDMLLYIDDNEVKLTVSDPGISYVGNTSLIFVKDFAPYINSILSCNQFGFNWRNKRDILTEDELANVKKFLTVDR